jgi:uncharacterized protein (TIGR00369 family)
MNDGGAKPSCSEIEDPDIYLSRLTREVAGPRFHDLLGLQTVSANQDGTVVVRLPFRQEFSGNRETFFYHGGVIAALIDATAHAAVAIHVGRSVPTLDLRIDYLRAATGGNLLASGRALSVGRSIGRADVEVRSEDGKLIAVGRGAFSTLPAQ